MTVPYTFGTATTSIPLSNLDANFNTPITLGNTSIYLGNTTTTIGNLTLTNVIISSGTANITSNITYATANAVVFTNSSSIGTTSAALTFDGSNIVVNSTTPAYFTGTSNLAQISINRSPSTGAIFNASQSAAFINIDGVSGGSSIQFATATANNTQPTERMRIDSSGNVGIGVTPSTQYSGIKSLQIGSTTNLFDNGASTKFYHNAYTAASGDDTYLTTGYAQAYLMPSNGQHIWYTSASGTAGNTISFTQAMTLDASGALCLNTTSAIDSGILQVAYASGVNNGIIFRTNGTGSQYAAIFYNGNGAVGSITTNGIVTAYNVSSDYRLKTNIVDAPSGNIDSIKVRSFDWIVDGSHQEYGMVAQELIEVAPYAVTKTENPDDMMQLDYSKLVPMMIKEIQDLKAEVNQLKVKIGV